MERLTYDCYFGDIHWWHVKGAGNLGCRQVCEEQEENGCKGCPIELAFDRLAAYEDTGFTPEEVQQMRWIPVEERLPEPGERVLATDCGFVGEFYINKRGKWQRYNVNCSELLMALDILYWMPLPALPDRRPPVGEEET
ncbi:MAG: DUF551 domain-containing protein [Acutalibacter sp.]